MKGNQENQKINEEKKKDLDQYLLIPIFLILLIIATSEARSEEAQTSTVKIEDAAVVPSAEITKKFALSLTLEHSSDLKARNNPDRDESTSLIVEPKYDFTDKVSLAGRVDLVQNYDSERKTALTNSVVVLTPTKIDLSKEVIFKPNLSITLPTDETLKDDESYQGTVSLRPTVEFNRGNLTLANVLYLNKNFHEYEFKRDYSANNEYTIRNRVVIAYMITEKLGLELVNDYARSWTYNRFSKDTFYFAQELSYEFKKNWSALVSHKNEGSARGPNNNGENVAITDSKSSYIALGLSHVF